MDDILESFTDEERSLADDIWRAAQQPLPPGCWKPHHTAAFVSGSASLSDNLMKHLLVCPRCRCKVAFRSPEKLKEALRIANQLTEEK